MSVPIKKLKRSFDRALSSHVGKSLTKEQIEVIRRGAQETLNTIIEPRWEISVIADSNDSDKLLATIKIPIEDIEDREEEK